MWENRKQCMCGLLYFYTDLCLLCSNVSGFNLSFQQNFSANFGQLQTAPPSPAKKKTPRPTPDTTALNNIHERALPTFPVGSWETQLRPFKVMISCFSSNKINVGMPDEKATDSKDQLGPNMMKF